MDIAEYLTIRPNLFAVTKQGLSNRDELVLDFSDERYFNFKRQNNIGIDIQSIQENEPSLNYDAIFDVTVILLHSHYAIALQRLYVGNWFKAKGGSWPC